MQPVTTIAMMFSAICLALGLFHLRVWFSERDRWDYLAISTSCIGAGVYSWFEISMAHAKTAAEWGELFWWSHFPGWVAVVSVAWFLYVHVGGRRWLFWSIFGLRGFGVVLNFFSDPVLNFREISLIVADNGCGFDLDAVKNKESIGLISTNERIRAVVGAIKVESVVGAGTKIEVHIPINAG